VNYETRALYSSGIFVLKVSMKHVPFLIGWLGKHMNLRPVALILTCHPIASLLMPLLRVKFAIALIMTALLLPIIFLMKVLPDLVV